MKKSQFSAVFLIVISIMILTACKKQDDSASAFETGNIMDVEGNSYKTIKIGNQWWMAENLKVTRYRNGEPVTNITSNAEWIALITPAYCSYNNDYDTYGKVKGLLYNWYVVDPSSNGNKNIAPEGWHIPTNADFSTLVNCLGGLAIAGGKMKEVGTSHWSSPNTGATNSSGFTSMPSGFRSHEDGTFQYIGTFVHWWSSTQSGSTAMNLSLANFQAAADNSASNKKLGFSIICVKD